MAADPPRGSVSGVEVKASLSFDRLFAPIVLNAREQLRQQTDPRLHDLLAADAHEDWEGYLLRRFNSAGKKVAGHQFQTFCSSRSAFPRAPRDHASQGDAAYREFVGDNPAERLRKIFDEYPGLAQIFEMLAANWVSTVREFLERLGRDLPSLPCHFEGGSFTCPIEKLHVGLSDPHRGGRCVVRIDFSRSVSLIYKPRSLAPEAHFAALLEHLNTEGSPHDFRSARCWDREKYGWMENVAPRACNKPADLHAFYWRAGALLALIYLSRGVDMHRENLIADGAYPVLIDLETLWHPQEHIGAADHPIASTVLRTGFLPQTDPLAGATYGWNALSHCSGPSFQASRHLPMLAGKAYPAPDFLPDILAGFRWIGGQVFEELRTGGEFQLWVQGLARCRRRRILRSTSWYRSVIEGMIEPSSLRNVESLPAECSGDIQNDPPITKDERVSLLQMDIPYVEQTVEDGQNREVTLPMQNIEAFLKQEAIIIDAFAPAANKGGL